MRSSSGEHYIALDHVRALAAFMVIAWHFTHGVNGSPVPFQYVPSIFPFALLDEGHTGVGLFMTLSGYLFAKILDGKTIRYLPFLWNRVLRLVPLLAFVILIVGIAKVIVGESLAPYLRTVALGVVSPGLPNGGWSITVEFHYYLILPLFLWMLRKSRLLPLSIVIAALVLRFLIHHEKGTVQWISYCTIFGRVDQFALGMLVFSFRGFIARRHVLAITIMLGFALFYWNFDRMGGFYLMPSYPSPSPIWIYLPTAEAIGYAVGIAWYESSFVHSTTGVSRFIGRMGAYSYSIYLLHFFFVFHASRFVHERIMDISNFYLACGWALVFFVSMTPIGYLSFRFIEGPFLKLRKRYFVQPVARDAALATAVPVGGSQVTPMGIPDATPRDSGGATARTSDAAAIPERSIEP